MAVAVTPGYEASPVSTKTYCYSRRYFPSVVIDPIGKVCAKTKTHPVSSRGWQVTCKGQGFKRPYDEHGSILYSG